MSVQAAATALVIALLGAGVILWWRLVLSPAARANRPPPRVAEWPLPVAEFLQFLLCVICGTVLGGMLGGLALKLRPLGPDAKMIFLMACSQTGWIAGLVVFKLGVERVRRPTLALGRRELTEGAGLFLVALPLALIAGLAWHGVLHACGLPVEKQDLIGLFQRVRSPVWLTLLVVGGTVLAPVAEELVFRAGLFRFLRTRVPRWGAYALSACVFAALHFNLAGFAGLVALGVVFAAGYERTGRIATAIVAHGLFNLLAVIEVLAGIGG
jgi:uncharacterized protein